MNLRYRGRREYRYGNVVRLLERKQRRRHRWRMAAKIVLGFGIACQLFILLANDA